MSGTVSGGKKAAQTNIKKHGKDFYRDIGRKGGKRSRGGGFASQKVGKDGLTGTERAKLAGHKGGSISRYNKKAALKRLQESQSKLANVLKEFIETPKEAHE